LDTYDFLTDPRTPTLSERREMREQFAREHDTWLRRLRELAEEHAVDDDFPAFLLATQPFEDLARRIGRAATRAELATEVADEVDWFLQAFADYLRTQDGEDAFPEPRRLTG